MPRWVLRCPKCHSEFTYQDIETPIIQLALRDPFGIVPKPTVANAEKRDSAPRVMWNLGSIVTDFFTVKTHSPRGGPIPPCQNRPHRLDRGVVRATCQQFEKLNFKVVNGRDC